MTKYLSTVLQLNGAVFAKRIHGLEDASVRQGIDIRLTNEISLDTKRKIVELGLDPLDTTEEELFHALQAKLLTDEKTLRKCIGISADADSVAVLQSASEYMQKFTSKQQVWCIKKATLKKVLSGIKMSRTMKVLGYRSETSLIKRESVTELYAISLLVEGDVFKQKLQQSMKKMKPSDFELRSLDVICFSKKRWDAIAKATKKQTVPVYSLPEIGALVVIPVGMKRTEGLALLTVALLVKELRHVKQHATYIKVRTMDPLLHLHVQHLAENGTVHMFTMQEFDVHWHHAHRLLSNSTDMHDLLGPHITQTDLEWLSIEAYLAAIDPSLSFWTDTHILGYKANNTLVSLHVMDVCFTVLFGMTLQTATHVFLTESTKNELIHRYLQVPPFTRILQEELYKLTDTDEDLVYAGEA